MVKRRLISNIPGDGAHWWGVPSIWSFRLSRHENFGLAGREVGHDFMCITNSSAIELGAAEQIHGLIVEVRDRLGVTGLIVTHSQACARTVGDRIGIMNEGRIVEEGTVEEMEASPTSLVRSFLSSYAD